MILSRLLIIFCVFSSLSVVSALPAQRVMADDPPTSGSISGTVYQANGITPIGNIVVFLHGPSGQGQSQCTDVSGNYIFNTVLFGQEFTVEAAPTWGSGCSGPNNYVPEFWQETPDSGNATALTVTAQAPTQTGIDFTLDIGGSISGTVYEADGVTPIPGIFVQANGNPTYFSNACTDSSGHFALHGLPFGVQLKVQASPPWANCGQPVDYVQEFWQETRNSSQAAFIVLTPPTPDAAGVDFTLDQGGSVSGTAYAADGITLLQHVAISFQNGNNYENSVCTDVNGHYTFHGAPFDLPLRVRADASRDGWCGDAGANYTPEYWQETLQDGPTLLTVTAAFPQQTNVNFTLDPAGSMPVPNLDVWHKDGIVEAIDWPAGTHLKLKIEDTTTPLSPDYIAETDVIGNVRASFNLDGQFEIEPGMIVAVSGAYRTAIIVVRDLTITSIDPNLDIIAGGAPPNDWLWMYYSPGFCCRSTVTNVSGLWTMDFSVLGPNGEPVVDIAPGSAGAIHDPSGDGKTSVAWYIPYIKANPTSDTVHVYGMPRGTNVTISIDRPSTGAGEDYNTNATVGQAAWDPGNANDLVADFNLSGVFDLQVGDVITATTTSTTTIYTVTGLTSVRWFIGLGTGGQPEQIPIEQQVVNDFNSTHPNIELLMEVQPNPTAGDTLAQEIADGNSPDIVGPVGWKGSNAFHGQWLDLESLSGWAGYDTSQFDPVLLNSYRTDEGQVALPFAVYPSAIYYNPALFDAAGLNYPPAHYGQQYEMPDTSMVTWDWDRVAQIGKLLTLDSSGRNATNPNFDSADIVQYGFSFGWANNPNYWGSFWQPGSILQTGGTPGNYVAEIPNAWKAAWEWVYAGMWGIQPYIPNGSSSYLNDSAAFANGQLAMLENPSWYMCCINNLLTTGGTFQLGAMPAYNGQVAGRVDADTFRILQSSVHRDEAFTVLTYLVGPAVDKLIVGNTYQPPAYGAMSAITTKQQAFLDTQATQFPFVTADSWNVLRDGLDFPDVPSAEGWMPNFNTAWDRLLAFSNDIGNTPGVNMGNEITGLQADLQCIFNSGQAVCNTPTRIYLPLVIR